MRPDVKSPKQRYSRYAAVLNTFMLLHMLFHAVSVFEFPTLVSEPYFSFGSLIFHFNLSNINIRSHLKVIILMLVFEVLNPYIILGNYL